MSVSRRMPVGAEQGTDGTHFRVWAPEANRVEVVFQGKLRPPVDMEAERDGYYSVLAPGVGVGALYRFRLNGRPDLFPDPASRFQPDGPHGPSQVVHDRDFTWTDAAWPGIRREGQVVYEMHVGTFTEEGTWAAAAEQLPALAELGVTTVEIMPVADFPGRFGWGYDGVNLFAPTRLYGSPDDLRHFVDEAHAAGLSIVLDVVYNHFGPDGNYLKAFAKDYFTDRYKNDWGEAINFDGPRSGPVREFFLANAGYWIDEFHMDGLRLDATQQIFDSSQDNIVTALARRVREAGGARSTWIVAENEPQEAKLVRPADRGGYGLDALWNDDFHHSAHVALTGKNEAYYTDYLGNPQEFISAFKWGFLYQGQRYAWQKKRRGTPSLDVAPHQFVTFLQNHDQVANSGQGLRCHLLTSPGKYRALTALFLLGPCTPMLFQGQEFGSSSPFHYFADHQPKLANLVERGRREFLAQFPSLARADMQELIPNPADAKTFEKCRLDFGERESHAAIYALHRDLLKLRREDVVFRAPRRRGLDGAVVAPQAFVLRFFAEGKGEGEAGDDRLVIVNLGRDLLLKPAPEPLLAPPEQCEWKVLWSSEDVRYGGSGTPALESDGAWRIPGEACVVLKPGPRENLSNPILAQQVISPPGSSEKPPALP